MVTIPSLAPLYGPKGPAADAIAPNSSRHQTARSSLRSLSLFALRIVLNDPTRFVVKVRKSIDKEIDPHLKEV